MIRIGVIGIDDISSSYLEILKGIEGYEISGIYAKDWEGAKKLAEKSDIPFFFEPENLINSSDALTILDAGDFYDLIVESVKQAKHVFIKYPFISSLKEYEQLIKLVQEADAKVQVAHPYSENEAFRASIPYINTPFYIEMVNNHGVDDCIVSEDIKQLMVYDLSMLLCIVKSGVKRIYSNGFAIKNGNSDVISIRIEFGNGSIANFTTSRLGVKRKHKYLIYQKDEIVSINFKKDQSNLYSIEKSFKNKSQKTNIFNFDSLNITMSSMEKELITFMEFIENGKPPLIELEDNYYALQLACEIEDRINRTMMQVEPS